MYRLTAFIQNLQLQLQYYPPTTPLPSKGGGMVGIWNFWKVKFPTRGARRVFKSPPGKVGYSAVEAKLILWTVKSPTSGAIFQVKSDQIPHYSPGGG